MGNTDTASEQQTLTEQPKVLKVTQCCEAVNSEDIISVEVTADGETQGSLYN